MCNPVAGVMVAGALVGAYAAKKEAEAQNEAAEYNAKLAEDNAKVAEEQSKDAISRGKLEEKQHRMKVKMLKGSQRAAFGASGVLVDSGSAMDTVLDTERFGEEDALTIRSNAAKEAKGYKDTAKNYYGQAKLSRMEKRSPGRAFGLSLLSGGSRLGSMYYAGKS